MLYRLCGPYLHNNRTKFHEILANATKVIPHTYCTLLAYNICRCNLYLSDPILLSIYLRLTNTRYIKYTLLDANENLQCLQGIK